MPLNMQDSSKFVEMLSANAKKPAASIDGNLFVLAAQKYNLPDDIATLNKIVELVNQGKPINEAAMMVAQNQKGIKNAIN